MRQISWELGGAPTAALSAYLDSVQGAAAVAGALDAELSEATIAYLARALGHVNVRWFGAIGDGTTDNVAAIEAAFAYAVAEGYRTVLIPPCETFYSLSRTLVVPSQVRVVGSGYAGRLKNVSVSGDSTQKCLFMVGNWHPAHNGVRAIGGPTYVRLIDRYAVSGSIAEKAKSVTLGTVAHAGNFAAGDFAYLRSAEVISQTSTGLDIEVPVKNTWLKVVSANAETGVVTFETAVGFAAATPYLCKIQAAATSVGFPVYIVENVEIENIYGEAFAPFANCGAYKCNASGIRGVYSCGIWLNAWCHGGIKDCDFDFTILFVELKFTCHDLDIYDIRGRYRGTGSGDIGLLHIGEYARNINAHHLDCHAPGWNAAGNGQVVQAQTGTNVRLTDSNFYCPDHTGIVIQLYADAGLPLSNCWIERNVFVSGIGWGVVYAGSSSGDRPRKVWIEGNKFLQAATSPFVLIFGDANAGQDTTFKNNYAQSGVVLTNGAVVGAAVIGNEFVDGAGFSGSNTASLYRSGNFTRTGGTFVELNGA